MAPTDRPSIEALMKQVQRLQNERDIIEVLELACYYADSDRDQEWSDLFGEDAIYEVRYPPPVQGFKQVGHSAIAEYAANAPKRRDRLVRHLTSMPRVKVIGDEATAESYVTALIGRGGRPSLWRVGKYRDRLVNTEGKWRFKERVAEISLGAKDTT